MDKYCSKQNNASKKNIGSKQNGGKGVLKNTSLKKKSSKPKKLSRGKIIKKLDIIFSRYIRQRDMDAKGIITCPLCGDRIPWKQAQNMHFLTRGFYKYRRDEINCHAGCYRCNVLLKGNYINYTRYMQEKYGMVYVDEMIREYKYRVIEKIHTWLLEEKIRYYESLVI